MPGNIQEHILLTKEIYLYFNLKMSINLNV